MPTARREPIDDPVLGPLTDDLLTRDVRVFQRAKGHRFSSDDVATAFVAWRTRPEARSVLDLGTGLGSVLLMLAWKMPQARFVGVEAQAISFELLRRNLVRNEETLSVSARIEVHHGDLRDPEVLGARGAFELVTGTPPYFAEGHAIDANDEQRAKARIEYRGGVEGYLDAAARTLAQEGTFVMCGDARADERARKHALALGLRHTAQCDFIPREGKAPLFSVWTFVNACETPTPTPWKGVSADVAREVRTLRDANGRSTPDAALLRVFSGFEPLID